MGAIILINDNWEQVKDLSDIVRIVEENIGFEFAREVERICGEPSADLEEDNLILSNKIDNHKNTQKELRELFIKVLDLAVEERLSDDKADELLNDFNAFIEGDN